VAVSSRSEATPAVDTHEPPAPAPQGKPADSPEITALKEWVRREILLAVPTQLLGEEHRIIANP